MDFSDRRYRFYEGTHEGKNVIWIQFEKNAEMMPRRSSKPPDF